MESYLEVKQRNAETLLHVMLTHGVEPDLATEPEEDTPVARLLKRFDDAQTTIAPAWQAVRRGGVVVVRVFWIVFGVL